KGALQVGAGEFAWDSVAGAVDSTGFISTAGGESWSGSEAAACSASCSARGWSPSGSPVITILPCNAPTTETPLEMKKPSRIGRYTLDGFDPAGEAQYIQALKCCQTAFTSVSCAPNPFLRLSL